MTGGMVTGPIAEKDQPDWAAALIQRFRDATEKRTCPHLQTAPDATAAVWIASAPDLLACRTCEGQIGKELERRLGHQLSEEPARCSLCDVEGPVRWVSVAVGNVLLRGSLCARCAEIPTCLVVLDLEPILIDHEALEQATDRDPFDELGARMLARAGQLTERLITATGRDSDGSVRALDLDQAVIGGLLVRTAKLTHAIFEAAQSESEAHSPLARCLGETSITLRWLVLKSSADSYERFRADSFARFHGIRNAPADDIAPVRDAVLTHLDRELEAAGLSWDDVPPKPNTWGPNVRQRFEALDQAWLYDTLFVSHSNYVHPTWHEIRAFHLRTDEHGVHLDMTLAGMAPPAAFVLARLVVEACREAATVLPHDLPNDAIGEVVENTVHVSQELSVAFHDFCARGGLDEDLTRHSI